MLELNLLVLPAARSSIGDALLAHIASLYLY